MVPTAQPLSYHGWRQHNDGGWLLRNEKHSNNARERSVFTAS